MKGRLLEMKLQALPALVHSLDTLFAAAPPRKDIQRRCVASIM